MVRLPPTLRLFRCPTADRVAARELQEATRRKQDESSMVVVACRAKMRAAMSQSKVMPLYKGRLSAGQIAAGMNAARKNAKRLLEDAKLLLEAKRFPTACSLAILSIEESHKLQILRVMASAPTDADVLRQWKWYRDHRTKNSAWIILDLAMKGARTLKYLMPMFDVTSDHPEKLDVVKQIGFYTDCFGDGLHWSEPDDVIDEELANQIVMRAEILLPKKEIIEREIEIWIEHTSAGWGTPKMFEGELEYHKALERPAFGSTHSLRS